MSEVTQTAPLTEGKELTLRFKKDKLDNKRADIKLSIPVLSFNGLVEILNNADGSHKKEFELLQEAVFDVYASAARSIVNEDEKITGNDNFPFDKISWTAIANQSKEDRRSNTIPDETWEGFFADYIAIMPGVTNKKLDAITNHTLVYGKKFAQVKTDKPTIEKLKGQLALYVEHSPNAEQFVDVIELLKKRADTYLAADDIKALTENL